MASPIASFSCAILSLLLSPLLFVPCSAITPRDMNTVCSQTSNPSFCTTFFKSIPYLSMSFKDLSQRTVAEMMSEYGLANRLMVQLLQQRTDPSEKQRLYRCIADYDKLQKTMITALDAIVGHYNPSSQLFYAASVSDGLAADCQGKIERTNLPLRDNNFREMDLSSILAMLAKIM